VGVDCAGFRAPTFVSEQLTRCGSPRSCWLIEA
jgi:hypothetical protein